MKTKFLLAAAFLVFGLAVSCNKNDKTETPTGAFSGYITNGDVAKEILRSAFIYYEADVYTGEDEEGDGICVIYLSPRNIEGTVIYQTHEWLMISIPLKLLGTVIDLDDPLQYNSGVQLEYHRGMLFCDIYGGVNPGPRPGTLKVTKAEGNNYFEVELTDMELRDGTILSCQAAGIIDAEDDYDYSFYKFYITGKTDFTLNGIDFTSAGYTCYCYGWLEKVQSYVTVITVVGYGGTKDYQLSFYIPHTTPLVNSGSYYVENIYHAWFMDVTYFEGGSTGSGYAVTAGSFDLEISDDYCKLTLNSEIETASPDVPVFPVATFTFDYRDI